MSSAMTMLAQAADKLGLSADATASDVIEAVDDFFHVPRHEPSLTEARERVAAAVQKYNTSNELPTWFIAACKHLSIH